MKKNYLFSALAASLMLFASCSQEEIISTVGDQQEPGSLATISVNLPEEAATRAMPTVEGFTRRCILQLVDASGVAISGYRYEEEVTAETVSFTYEVPAEADYQCVFWADYIQTAETDYIYDTQNLPNIGYTGMNNGPHFTDAADAFCGVLNPATAAITTLTRPLTRINLGTETPANFSGYTNIEVSRFNIPAGYDIFNQTALTTENKEIRLASQAMTNAETGDWAHFYVFAAANETSFSTNMVVTVSGESVENKTSTITSLTLDANMLVDMNFTEDPEAPETMDVTVSFGDEYENQPIDPNAPLAVGDYIDATGAKTDASSAVAVVFALAEGKVDASTYGEGNTVEAYAVSLTKAAGRAYLKDGSAGTWTPTLISTATMDTESPYSGYQMSSDMLTSIGDYASTLFTAYNTWVSSSSSISNASNWYIPSYAQLQDILTLDNATLKEALNGAYTSTYFLISSSVNADLTIHGSSYNSTDGTVQNANQNIDPTSHQGVIFPVVTIFE